jgi:hypothetical protein
MSQHSGLEPCVFVFSASFRSRTPQEVILLDTTPFADLNDDDDGGVNQDRSGGQELKKEKGKKTVPVLVGSGGSTVAIVASVVPIPKPHTNKPSIVLLRRGQDHSDKDELEGEIIY